MLAHVLEKGWCALAGMMGPVDGLVSVHHARMKVEVLWMIQSVSERGIETGGERRGRWW